ncbi:MAG: type II toxin-antitoxin system PemK/MazF family toxin [Clostridiales bacterium]|nr:type II toxin-antitoxin system PemK/MazF family toxin [Clostridiales bacterium]
MKRGDIFYADLNPVIGSEQGSRRPVLIISNDIGNTHSPTVIIVPITSRVHTKAKLPTHAEVDSFEGPIRGHILMQRQMRDGKSDSYGW